jgi:hypothetical protein
MLRKIKLGCISEKRGGCLKNLLLPYDKYYSIHIKINKVRAARQNIMRCNKFITTHQNSSSDVAIHGPHDTVVFWAGTTGTGVSQITKVGSEGRTGFC